MTTDDFAPDAGPFSCFRSRLSNSIGPLPSLLISILNRCPAGTSSFRGSNDPSRATSLKTVSSSPCTCAHKAMEARTAAPNVATSRPLESARSSVPEQFHACTSVATLLADACVCKVVLHGKRLEPWTNTGFLVGMTSEMAAWRPARRRDRQLQGVFAGTSKLHVVAVVRSIVGHHRHQLAGDLLTAALLGDLIVDTEVGNPRAVGKSVAVVALRVDVGLEVDVRLGHAFHHAQRLHRDWLQIDRGDLHACLDLGLADRGLECKRRRCSEW